MYDDDDITEENQLITQHLPVDALFNCDIAFHHFQISDIMQGSQQTKPKLNCYRQSSKHIPI